MAVDRLGRPKRRRQPLSPTPPAFSNPYRIIPELRGATQPAHASHRGEIRSPGLRPSTQSPNPYDFLLSHGLDVRILAHAAIAARNTGVADHLVLIAEGRIAGPAYTRALARHTGLALAEPESLSVTRFRHDGEHGSNIWASTATGKRRVLDAMAYAPDVLAAHLALTPAARDAFALASRDDIDRLIEDDTRRQRMDDAVHGLWRRTRSLSARQPMALWQTIVLALMAGLLIGGLGVAPELTMGGLTALLSLPFFCVVLLRAAAALEIARSLPAPDAALRRGPMLDVELPTYSIMVPLFDEADVLPRLVQSLSALDYPAAKLEVFLVLESVDKATRDAASAMRLPANFRTVIVPRGGPQTKPKALNYVLGLVRGDFVVVYDAEDRPEPGQLRRALEAFGRSDQGLVCVQARLNVYNPHASFFTRQFALEYSALFDAILPALERLSLPVPLGGTSNHFRTSALRDLGAWDAFNVTEDADLGIRLARAGLRTATIASTTWEEAPVGFRNWLPQRTRWLKGWMQTYIVHMRHPRRLIRDLGLPAFLGFQAFMGGILLSVLVHPIVYALVAWEAWRGRLFVMPDNSLGAWLWWIAGVNLALGYATAILVGALAVARRRRWRLVLSSFAMPVYWLLISAAGYRALVQLIHRPYHWEKTQHGVAGKPNRRAG
jgi:cellulose synthase/poly-beta-1,6-N-acetylglucosamine synthase-like glycosyltransferase